MKFAPEYVTFVLNENFEDAKALLLSPMMAINYAHLVMLALRGLYRPPTRTRCARRWTACRRTRFATSSTTGPTRICSSTSNGSIIQACGEDVAGRLHTARSRNDIDMTMYRMRQREFVLGLLAATFELRRSLLDLVDRHRDTIFAVHTHTQRAQPTTVAHYLLAVVEQLERDAVAAQRRVRAHESQSARRLRHHRHRVSHRSAVDRRSPWLLRADRQYLRQHRHGRLSPRERVGRLRSCSSATAASCRTCSSGPPRSSAMSDSATASCSAAASCRRSAIRSRSSTRAPSAARRSVRRRRSVTAVHNTPFGDIVDTEDDLQPLVFSMFRDATRAVKLVAAAMTTAEFDAGAPRSARRRRLDHADRVGRHPGARSRLAVPHGPCDCRPADYRQAAGRRPPSCGRPCRRVEGSRGRADRLLGSGAREDSQPPVTSSPCAARSAAPRRKRPRAPPVSRVSCSAQTTRGGNRRPTRWRMPNTASPNAVPRSEHGRARNVRT